VAAAEERLAASLGRSSDGSAATASPATTRVLRYLYDPERPHRVSVLDIADASGLTPRRAFEQVQILTTLELVGQDLAFEVTLAHGVSRPSKELAHESLAIADALFTIGTDLDDDPVIRIRGAAAEMARTLGRKVAPHRLSSLLRALRRQGLLQLDKYGPDLYRVHFEPGAIAARDRLRRAQRVAGALFEHLEEQLGSTRGRDLICRLDINGFVERPTLTERFSHEETVATCLLLHHLDAWHLADPPVLFDMAMRVRVDPNANLGQVDSDRPARHHQHQIQLVHMMREYAVLEPSRRQRYVDDYFRLSGAELTDAYFQRRKRAISRPVSAATEVRILEGLTPEQREAVTAEDHAVLVVAGPGSGKTHTVVRRITHMIRARQIRADHILVLAFNRSAASELRARLLAALGDRAGWVDVRTFHSLAVKLTGAELFDRQDADPDARLDQAMAEAAALLAADDEEDRERATYLRQQVLGGVRHVLVDEYQDLDPAQYALLSALVGLDRKRRGLDRTERSVYVVGDDDQAIYGFRDASVEFLRRFEEEFGARRVCLRDNFRSNQAIAGAAQRFIESAPGRHKTRPDEQMRAAPGAPAGDDRAVRRLRYGSAEEMAAHTAYAVQRLLEQPTSSGTIAVLARHWADLDPVRYLLEAAGIELAIHHRDFKRPVHRRHPVAFLLDKLWRKREPLLTSATEHLGKLLDGLKRAPEEPVCRELLALAADIDGERASAGRLPLFGAGRPDPAAPNHEGAPARRRPPRGQLELLAAEDTDLSRPQAPLANPLLAPMTTAELADALVLASRDAAARDSSSTSAGARVHLSTYHGAKGLEFDQVIVLPARRSSAAGSDRHEERRAFYVAMTRARRELALATLGADDEHAAAVEAPLVDLRNVSRKLGTVRAAYLDCDPSHMRLFSTDLARAQRIIARLREGEPLEIQQDEGGVWLCADGELVAELSRHGRERLAAIERRAGGPPSATVHEIFQHYERDESGRIVRRWLVVLPTFRCGAAAGAAKS
jgi:ATP-dependent DNA helicase RecQ